MEVISLDDHEYSIIVEKGTFKKGVKYIENFSDQRPGVVVK